VDGFLNAAIGWESFRSDWHIAAINRDSGPFVGDLQATDGTERGAARRHCPADPTHLARDATA